MGPVKLVDSVPGAPPVSTESINIKIGAAYKQGKKTIYYGTVPKKCPKGGFPVKVELTFATGETVDGHVQGAVPQEVDGGDELIMPSVGVSSTEAKWDGRLPPDGRGRPPRC